MTTTTKVSELKLSISNITGITIPQQRLIYAGRRLDNDDKPLSDFKITGACTIHLFPIPLANLTTDANSTVINININQAGSTQPGGTINPLHGALGTDAFHMPSHTPLHFDYNVAQTTREVKLWCMILMFLSFMTLIDVLTSLVSDTLDITGNGVLHAVVAVLNILCSVGGVIVAQLGLKAARSLNMEEISKYVIHLRTLAVACMIMRILWVFDIVQQVQKIVDKANDPNSPTVSPVPSLPPSQNNKNKMPLDQNTVHSYTIQVYTHPYLILPSCKASSCKTRINTLYRRRLYVLYAPMPGQPVWSVLCVLGRSWARSQSHRSRHSHLLLLRYKKGVIIITFWLIFE